VFNDGSGFPGGREKRKETGEPGLNLLRGRSLNMVAQDNEGGNQCNATGTCGYGREKGTLGDRLRLFGPRVGSVRFRRWGWERRQECCAPKRGDAGRKLGGGVVILHNTLQPKENRG